MMYPMYYYIDPTYFLVLIGVMLSLAASSKVNSTYARYARVGAAKLPGYLRRDHPQGVGTADRPL